MSYVATPPTAKNCKNELVVGVSLPNQNSGFFQAFENSPDEYDKFGYIPFFFNFSLSSRQVGNDGDGVLTLN